ncbi:glutaredoxin family protein [Nocardioides sp. CFH 31398]|uniref:glutaredoxin family protein n=1 Tax=Nocardioides sp. CFH 31398 TaxID=2919579 RepID=UPI001F059FC9|nr:glutaredoxin family protein [Nocardioides sp. CFH 31398]MCH1865142.1 glutaredoxin family protein [Nocardioides sp. CFH 31398]
MSGATGKASDEARVTFVTREGCHLCEEARAVVAAVCAEVGERFVEVDVDDDPALLARYDEQVPVTFVDGRQHDFWRVDAGRLRRALTEGGRVG